MVFSRENIVPGGGREGNMDWIGTDQSNRGEPKKHFWSTSVTEYKRDLGFGTLLSPFACVLFG